MRASDIMTTGVVTVSPDADVHNVAQLMIQHRVGGLPVVDAKGCLVGIVTDGDLYRRIELGTDHRRSSWLEIFGLDAAQARDYIIGHARTVGDVMSTRVLAVTPDTPVRQIAGLFERERIRRVPVVADGTVVGIVSRANLVQALASVPPEELKVNLSDRRVRDLVIAEYKRLPWGVSSESNVIVTDGVVHLWGLFPSDVELDALRVAAEGIPGVIGLEDHTYRYFGDVSARTRQPSQVIIEEANDEVPQGINTGTTGPKS